MYNKVANDHLTKFQQSFVEVLQKQKNNGINNFSRDKYNILITINVTFTNISR